MSVLYNLQRALRNGHGPCVIVLNSDDADALNQELKPFMDVREHKLFGPIYSWCFEGVPVAVAAVRKSYVMFDYNGIPTAYMI